VALRRVLPDTNVCYPISLLDLLLRLDEASLHAILWTEELLEELATVWVANGARSREAAERVCADIRAAFAGQEVLRQEYEHLIEMMPGGDPDDRPHAAAAVARAPATILTRKVRDFSSEPLGALGVDVTEPDDYLVEMLRQWPQELMAVLRPMAADRSRPPATPREVLGALDRASMSSFAKEASELLLGEG
jgi:hypothetical protein